MTRTFPRAFVVVAAAAVVVGALGGCRPGTKDVAIPKGAMVIKAQHLQFTPAVVTVKVGQPVVWVFDDQDVPHDVRSIPTGPLRSGVETSGTYEYTFTAPGTYNYECTIHVMDDMTGKVIVVPR